MLATCFLCIIVQGQEFGGIGVMLGIDSTDGYTLPVIRGMVPNSPAAAKLKDSLFILKVDDGSCRNKPFTEVAAMIRGIVGTHVKLLVADNKKGRHANEYDLIRAPIKVPPAPVADPMDVFQKACEGETKQLRKRGYSVIKTFNSECGSFFFNFNADTGLYHIAMYSLEDKEGTDAITGSIYNSNNEEHVIKLNKTVGNNPAVQKGMLVFDKPGVGGIKTEVINAQKCKAIYIVVYK